MMRLVLKFVLLFVSLKYPMFNLSISNVMSDTGNKTIKIVLEIIKLVATALLGYFGGNAVL